MAPGVLVTDTLAELQPDRPWAIGARPFVASSGMKHNPLAMVTSASDVAPPHFRSSRPILAAARVVRVTAGVHVVRRNTLPRLLGAFSPASFTQIYNDLLWQSGPKAPRWVQGQIGVTARRLFIELLLPPAVYRTASPWLIAASRAIAPACLVLVLWRGLAATASGAGATGASGTATAAAEAAAVGENDIMSISACAGASRPDVYLF